MRTIPITINDEYIKGSGAVVGAAGSHDDVTLDITFGEAWHSLGKQIVWRNAMHDDPRITVLTPSNLKEGSTDEYLVPIPYEPKKYPGKMTMTVKGTYTPEEGREVYSTLTAYAEFIILESLWSEEAEESEIIDPTTTERVLNALEKTNGDNYKILNMTVSAGVLSSSDEATVDKTEEDGVLNLHFGIPRGEKGDKGERGEFTDLTPTQIDTLRKNMYAVYNTKSASYTVVSNDTHLIPIAVENYNTESDILSVYVAGLKLTEGYDYEIDGENGSITLAAGLSAGTVVQFEALNASVEAVSIEEIADIIDYVSDGVIYTDQEIEGVLVETTRDLEILTEYPAGTIAYTAGFADMWQLSAKGVWVKIT